MRRETLQRVQKLKLGIQLLSIGMVVICSHRQFGSIPTADVPMTNQVRPMQASVILEEEEHVQSFIFKQEE